MRRLSSIPREVATAEAIVEAARLVPVALAASSALPSIVTVMVTAVSVVTVAVTTTVVFIVLSRLLVSELANKPASVVFALSESAALAGIEISKTTS